MITINTSPELIHLHVVDASVAKLKKTPKTKYNEPKTSSIVLISLGIFFAIILLMFVGLSYTSHTGAMMKQHSTCRDKIIGFEEKGIYTSPEQFRLALSYCDAK